MTTLLHMICRETRQFARRAYDRAKKTLMARNLHNRKSYSEGNMSAIVDRLQEAAQVLDDVGRPDLAGFLDDIADWHDQHDELMVTLDAIEQDQEIVQEAVKEDDDGTDGE